MKLIEEIFRADPAIALELASLLTAHEETGILDRLVRILGNKRAVDALARGSDLGRDVALELLPVWRNRDPMSRAAS